MPCTFIAVKGAGHGRFRSPEVQTRVRLFLEKHLLGRDVAVSAEPIGRGP